MAQDHHGDGEITTEGVRASVAGRRAGRRPIREDRRMFHALRGSLPRVGRLGFAGLLAAAHCVIGEPARAAAEPEPKVAFTVTDSRISEASGLAVSRRHPGVVYTHNDSDGSPTIFAIGPNGRTRATYTIAGAEARDWEGMALGRDGAGRPALFVADIGDNLDGAWPYVTVYRVPEPRELRDQTLRATPFRLKYADGARNAEAVLIHPRTNRLYVASKLLGGALYAAPARLRPGGFNVLREVGDAPAIATDGAFAPDGRSFVIRTYGAAHVYEMTPRGPGDRLRVVNLPEQEQGESIAYSLDGRSLLVGSEGVGQPVWRVPLPADALPAESGPSASATARPPGAAEEEPGRETGDTMVGLGVAAGLAMVIAVFVARRRR
jgi:hypothetical protein